MFLSQQNTSFGSYDFICLLCFSEPTQKETLLHLVMKLGLIELSQFLAAQPGGSVALTLPNADGATPLDLAVQNGHSKLVEVFTK